MRRVGVSLAFFWVFDFFFWKFHKIIKIKHLFFMKIDAVAALPRNAIRSMTRKAYFPYRL